MTKIIILYFQPKEEVININNYWAKSNPKETIQEHTDSLLKNLCLFKSIYPNIPVNYELLKLACIYHDLGKMNIRFQAKIQASIDGKKSYKDKLEIPHGILSLSFINYKYLEDKGFTEDEIRILFHAVAYHHDRDLDFEEEDLGREISLLKKECVGFKYDKADELIQLPDEIEAKFYMLNDRIYEKNDDDNNNQTFYDYIKIKGLLNRLDYAASAGINVEVANDFLIQGLEKLKEKENWGEWNKLQQYMINNRDNNVVVIAQTGMGKTEAGLLWIGNNKGFFTLPLKTAINEIYNRITKKIVPDREKVGLLHSETIFKYHELQESIEELDIDEYYLKTRQLSLPITVCTLDQLFDIVFKYRGFEAKLATLSYSKIVIDEVQMYSPDLLAYLIVGLHYIIKLGGKFAILTATLPGIVKYYLKGEGIEFQEPQSPFIKDELIRHSVKVIPSQINAEFILQHFNNNKVLVICNTVKKAREIFEDLNNNKKLFDKDVTIKLLHSRFTRKDRREKEEEIVEFGSKNSMETGIWVATQVVEASLDIDFDILITELSDLNGLFQRMGRCYRHRTYDKQGYNCFIFDGGERTCSGVGSVIDEDIFELSKEAINDIDGIMKESEKMQLVEKVYSAEKLMGTKYYQEVQKTINYIKTITEFEKSKDDINFRNIDNITILPKCVYLNNKAEIDELINIYKDEKTTKDDKRKCWIDIQNYLVNVPGYEVKKRKPEIIELSKYRRILVYDGFHYDSILGLVRTEAEEKGDNQI